jgi:uncharacterized protein (DUF924 family)
MRDRAEEILKFWFGETPDDLSRVERWFKKDAAFDASVRQRFGGDLELAADGALDDWADSDDPRKVLAFVVLNDQFPRNVFRGDARAFAQDARALDASLRGQERGVDRSLGLLERYVFYLPMMHAENLGTQRAGVAAYTRLEAEAKTRGAPDGLVAVLHAAQGFAQRHLEIIDRFGRFPHRNALLGRPATNEEAEFLKQPGSSF